MCAAEVLGVHRVCFAGGAESLDIAVAPSVGFLEKWTPISEW